jgi:hypothetical protein
MLIGFEVFVCIGAIVLGIVLFILALRRRIARDARGIGNVSGSIFGTNLYALAVIALVFFGASFLIDIAT